MMVITTFPLCNLVLLYSEYYHYCRREVIIVDVEHSVMVQNPMIVECPGPYGLSLALIGLYSKHTIASASIHLMLYTMIWSPPSSLACGWFLRGCRQADRAAFTLPSHAVPAWTSAVNARAPPDHVLKLRLMNPYCFRGHMVDVTSRSRLNCYIVMTYDAHKMILIQPRSTL